MNVYIHVCVCMYVCSVYGTTIPGTKWKHEQASIYTSYRTDYKSNKSTIKLQSCEQWVY